MANRYCPSRFLVNRMAIAHSVQSREWACNPLTPGPESECGLRSANFQVWILERLDGDVVTAPVWPTSTDGWINEMKHFPVSLLRPGIIAPVASLLALGPTVLAVEAASASPGRYCGSSHRVGCVDEDGTMMGRATAKPYLAVREGPGAGYAKVAKIRRGEVTWVGCWAYGSYVTGHGTRSDVWDYLPFAGGWVSDVFVNTGGISPEVYLDAC